jgi:hypothetical protein
MRWYMNMILQLFYGVPLVYQKLDVICDMGQDSASAPTFDGMVCELLLIVLSSFLEYKSLIMAATESKKCMGYE